MVNLALLLLDGMGIERNADEAAQWLAQAALLGDTAARNAWAVLVLQGEVAGDTKQAVRWLKTAAEAGDAKAQFNLGNLYRQGQFLPQDDHQALAWYRRAAAQGLKEAMNALGAMWAAGRGVPENEATARNWFAKAAQAGDALARANLGALEQGRRDFQLWPLLRLQTPHQHLLHAINDPLSLFLYHRQVVLFPHRIKP